MRVAHWTPVARQFRAPTVTSVPCCVPPPTPALSAVTCLIPSYCPGPSSSAWLPGHRLKASWGLRMAAAPADRTSAGFLMFSSCSQGSAVQEEPQNLGQCAVFRGWGWGLKPQRARHRVYTSLPPRPCLKLQPDGSNLQLGASLHASPSRPPPPRILPQWRILLLLLFIVVIALSQLWNKIQKSSKK